MKKVLLIGKFDSTTKEISDCLSRQYQVQLCSENIEILKGMLKMVNPDLITVSFTGSSDAAREMFAFLFDKCPDTPLLGIGNSSHEAELFINGYLTEDWVRFLSRPAAEEDILRCAGELAGQEDQEPCGYGFGFGDGDGEDGGERGEEGEASILLVDDSPALLRTMQAILSRKYRVTFATSGTQAIAAVAKSKPDLILLDYEMPVINGKMTLEMLRSEEDTRDIPVVFLTGIADSRHVMDVMALHPEGYLLKPCSEEKVLSTIERVLKEKKGGEDVDWELFA